MLNQLSGALNHDFCPWANRYVYWLKRPIGWVLLALLSSMVLGIYVSPQAFLATAGIAMVAIIGSVWPWISMIGVRGELNWDTLRCQELDSIQTTLVITNRWPWPVVGLTLDLDAGLLPEGWDKQRVSLQRIAGFSKSTFQWSTVPQTRGQYPRGQVHLSSGFPFGIWTSSRRVEVSENLIVWPRITRLIDAPTDLASQQYGTGSLSDRVGDDGDWTGVRPYRPGDSLRQVHWAQTARRDALVVFERQASASQSVVVQIDPSSAAEASETTLSAMLRLFASIVHQFQRHHWTVYVDLEGLYKSSGMAQGFQQSQRIAWMDRLAIWNPSLPSVESMESELRTRRALRKVQPNVVLTIGWKDFQAQGSDPSSIDAHCEDRLEYRFDVVPEASLGSVWDEQLEHRWQGFCRSQMSTRG